MPKLGTPTIWLQDCRAVWLSVMPTTAGLVQIHAIKKTISLLELFLVSRFLAILLAQMMRTV
ncbi:hypothetical protein OH492_00550 [Vibrio chagasii]|nr:hypothetical protein [Vibrio chagasii]